MDTPAQNEQQQFVSEYGGIASMAFTTPWIMDILNEAIDNNWTGTKFAQTVQQNPNWQSMQKGLQNLNTSLYANDGGQGFAADYNAELKLMQESAVAQGFDPSIFGQSIPANATPEQIQEVAKNSGSPVMAFLNQYYGAQPSQQIVDQYVAQHGTLATNNASTAQGAIATAATSLKNYASQYGVASQFLSPQWSGATGTVNTANDYFTNAAIASAQGLTNQDSIQANIRNTAAAIYKPFADKINQGYSVADLAAPYTSTVANLLEVSPDSIDLGNPTGTGALVTKALQGDGQNAMNLDAFTTLVKQQPAWLNTTNARNTLMDTATSMLRNFGLVVGQ